MLKWRQPFDTFTPRRLDRFAITVAIALSGIPLFSYVIRVAAQDRDPNPTASRPSAPSRSQALGQSSDPDLVVWSIDGDRQGIALALNALCGDATPYETERIEWAESRAPEGSSESPPGLYDVIRDLVDQKHCSDMRAFTLTLRGRKPETDGWIRRIRFQFAKKNSLSSAWKPLYESLATGKSLESLRFQYRSDSPSPRRWLTDLAWWKKLQDDLKQSDQSPVVIFGPGSSDNVPALWFLLRVLLKDCPKVTIPPMISASATWSVLGDPDKIKYSGQGETPWVTTLSRALGLSTDRGQFQYASEEARDRMCKVSESCQAMAKAFIQYARADDELVKDIHHELVQVRGYRKIGILYRDDLDPKKQSISPELTRRLYGPAISEEFRNLDPASVHLSKRTYIDSPFPKAPNRSDNPSEYPSLLADWEGRARDMLRPILRLFERERVEAVGVFGNSADEKRAILKIAREELPYVQLFTAEPDRELESPTPLTGAPLPQLEQPKDTPSYPLNGLMVFSGPIPSNELLNEGFRELNEVALVTGQGKPFLPSVFTLDSDHIIRRLIDLVFDQGTIYNSHRVENPTRKIQHGIHHLKEFLRKPSSLEVQDPSQDIGFHSDLSVGSVMLITNGRLHPISRPHENGSFRIVGIIGLLVLILSWPVWISLTPRFRAGPRSKTLWARTFQGGPASESSADHSEALKPANPRPWRPSRQLLLFLASLFLVILPALSVFLDLRNSRQISVGLIPDGHGILPSLLVFLLISILALWLPESFHRKIASLRPGASRFTLAENDLGKSDKFAENCENWRQTWVLDRLQPGRGIVLTALLIALVLTAIEVVSGIPVPSGWTQVLTACYEGITFWMISLTGLTFGFIGWSVSRLPSLFESQGSDSSEDHLARTDPEAIRHLGTIFISVVPQGLLIFALLLMARLHWLGFPRWRWNVHSLVSLNTPLIPLLYATALILILGYWYHCYRTFRMLIWQARNAKLRQQRQRWENSPAWLQQSAGERRKFETRRQEIRAIPVNPWSPGTAWRARAGLVFVVLTTAISVLFGPGSKMVLETFRPWLGL